MIELKMDILLKFKCNRCLFILDILNKNVDIYKYKTESVHSIEMRLIFDLINHNANIFVLSTIESICIIFLTSSI